MDTGPVMLMLPEDVVGQHRPAAAGGSVPRRQHRVLRHVPLLGVHLRGQLGWPLSFGRQPADVAPCVPCAGAQAGQEAVREHAVLVSRRSAGVRASVLGEAVTTPERKFGARPPP